MRNSENFITDHTRVSSVEDPITIFLAEEDQDDRELIFSILNDMRIPHKIFEVTDGLDLIDLLYKKGAYQDTGLFPDVIIMDLYLQGLSSFAMLQTIKADSDLKHVPVYILSNHFNKRDIEIATSFGSAGYYKKTYQYSDWHAALCQICTQTQTLKKQTGQRRSN